MDTETGMAGRGVAAQELARLRKAAGLSQAEAARQADCQQSDIAKLETDRKVLTLPWATRLAPIYKTRLDALMPFVQGGSKALDLETVAGNEVSTATFRAGGPNLTPNVDFNNLIPAEDLVGEKDLPVFGSAEGGPDGSVILDNTPVEWVKRPQPLFRVPKGFATFVVGSSMEPAYYPGDRLLVHPSRPPIHGSDVVIYRDNNDGTANALVKRLVRFDDERWFLRQYNPAADFELFRREWPKALAIVGKYAR